MDQQHESKRPRLSTPPSWSAGSSLHGVSLPQLGPPLTAPHLPAPSGPYQPSPHPFSRGPELPPPSHPSPVAHPPPHPVSHNPHPPPPPPQHFERRHHEPESPYPPMQEHRQPPPSPAHQPYPPYPPRDPIVKRDPAEDALPQLRRPNSTGNAPEPLPPGTPHGASIPPPGHMDDRRHLPYENGPPPPHMYRQPSYPPPPQTPLPPPTPYEQPMYGPPDALYPITYTSSSGKRKAQRASQACDMCRQLKAKCDELKPCKSCKEKNVECKYRDPVPKQQDKATADILDGISALQTMVQEGFVEIRARLARLEDGMESKVSLSDIPQRDVTMDFERPASPPAAVPEETISSPGETASVEAPIASDEAKKTIQEMNDDEEDTNEGGAPVPPGKPSMPVDHTTPAGNLLAWPCIADFMQPFLDKEHIKYVRDYPRRIEIRRGQLSLFGRGEGHDTRLVDRDGTADQGDIPDDVSVSSHPSSPGQNSDWGLIGGMTPPGNTDMRWPSVLRSDGSLDFEPTKVWPLVKSFEQHIQNMHPLIIPRQLYAMVQVFLDSFPAKKPLPVAQFANESSPETATEPPALGKRKRSSPGPDLVETFAGARRGRPQRSIQTALVLLVLALGKITQVRDRKIPDIMDPDLYASLDSPVVRNGQPTSPNQTSPPGGQVLQTSGQPSPKDQDRALPSRRSSYQAAGAAAGPPPGALPKKNYEVIPGLEYFAFATDILGNHLGGTQMIHVHAHILAGLYYGQLGRVISNFSHIRIAGSILMDNISSSLARFSREGRQYAQGKRDNQIATAFWSCLQLESDILAELNLHPSGILNYEEMVPWPDGEVLTDEFGFPADVVESFFCQLYLRKRLNEIHGLLYDPNKAQEPLDMILETIVDPFQDLNTGLFNMAWVPDVFRFQFSEPPSDNILAARIRAKFWGAQVITYRPFVRQIMELNFQRMNQTDDMQQLVPGDYRSDFDVPSVNTGTSDEISTEIIEKAHKGVFALIESTKAFHNLKDKRFVITNVFGTAHAQWGNCVTLAAVHRDPTLGRFVPERLMLGLLRKTIEFLQIVAQPTSSLAVDLRILQSLERVVSSRVVAFRANSSFSSSASIPPLTPAGEAINTSSASVPPLTPAGEAINTSMPAPSTPAPGVVTHPAPMQL